MPERASQNLGSVSTWSCGVERAVRPDCMVVTGCRNVSDGSNRGPRIVTCAKNDRHGDEFRAYEVITGGTRSLSGGCSWVGRRMPQEKC